MSVVTGMLLVSRFHMKLGYSELHFTSVLHDTYWNPTDSHENMGHFLPNDRSSCDAA
jgi:hypothetical protein